VGTEFIWHRFSLWSIFMKMVKFASSVPLREKNLFLDQLNIFRHEDPELCSQ